MLQRSDGKYTLINKKSGGGFIGFRVDNSDKMVINDYGNVGIGTTTPTAKLHVSGTYVNFDDTSIKISNTVGKTYALSSGVKMMWESGFSIRDVTTDTIPFYIDPNNNVTVTGILSSQSYACTSDSRFKKNISLYQNALEKILGLRGVTFFWKAEKYKDRNFGREKQIGFIAQEVEKVIPEIVYTDEKGFKTMSYDRLTAVLVEAVKELKAEKDDEITKSNVKIKTLENEIVVVKSENETLKANNAELKQKLAKLDSVLDRLASLEMKIEKQEGHCLAER